ncbi:MAG: flagellar assembly protein T N-terminal domain-containing protein [Myxococcales bacterium]|nr:flagellar assembly protein T N-terminal domain-containing protein [Myxococcales bacterium]
MTAIRLTLLSLSLSSLALAQATVLTKEGTGEAAIVNKDEAKAFAEAQQNALRAAVEQAAGVKIDADTVVVNNQLVRDQVFSNTSGYVKSFTVASKKVDKGVVTVTVKAEVITDNLDKDIEAARALVKRMGRPSITVVIVEQTIPLSEKSVINSNTIETVLGQQLKADGWDVINPNWANSKLKVQGGVIQGGTIDPKEIGDLSKVDFVLYGNATMRHQDFDPNVKTENVFPVTGEFDLTVFATDTGRDIGKVVGKLNPLKDPGKQLVSYDRTALNLITSRKDEIIGPLRKQVLEFLRNQSSNGAELNLVVSGLDGFSAANDFKKSVEAMKGVRAASAPKLEKGTARFVITFLGTSQELALAVESSTWKKKKLTVTTLTNNKVEVQVGK